MKYPLVMNTFYNQPLALEPGKAADIDAFLQLKAAGGVVAPERIAALIQARAGRGGGRGDGAVMAGKVAVLSVCGVLAQRVGMMEETSGGTSLQDLSAELNALVKDPAVSGIILAFDSPGGSVFGLDEFATEVRDLRAKKRIAGYTDATCASAAYWIAAQCSELWMSSGAQVGSIGVVICHTDVSRAMERKGLTSTIITSSKYKAEGASEAPLDPEARAEIQRKCDAYHAMFVAAVAKGRGVPASRVSSGFGEGRMMMATQARAAGMVDEIGTLRELIGKLSGRGPGSAQLAARARRATVEARAAEAAATMRRQPAPPAAAPARTADDGLAAKVAAARARVAAIQSAVDDDE